VSDGLRGVSFSRRLRVLDRVRFDRVAAGERRVLLVRGEDRLRERLREL
jgi:hypothetical protein